MSAYSFDGIAGHLSSTRENSLGPNYRQVSTSALVRAELYFTKFHPYSVLLIPDSPFITRRSPPVQRLAIPEDRT